MPVPDYQTLMLPLLKLFGEGKTSVNECIDDLRTQFAITDEEAAETIASGQPLLYNRAHWARTYLGKAGLLESPKRGVHHITDIGKRYLATNPERIDVNALKELDQFNDWLESGVSQKQETLSRTTKLDVEEEQTPEDAIQAANDVLLAALRDELLGAILQVSPARFEQLILELLSAMGFGKGRADFRILTPLSGDGGIDGIVNEDPLGLDAVYIQAKRYAPNNNVGRPDIQKFVGSLTGESATKGVFVTTSDFSRDAVSYIERVQHRIVLINGRRLAQLMIENGVGVRTRSVFEIKSLDEDYFSTP